MGSWREGERIRVRRIAVTMPIAHFWKVVVLIRSSQERSLIPLVVLMKGVWDRNFFIDDFINKALNFKCQNPNVK
jgi:hypothetical protein